MVYVIKAIAQRSTTTRPHINYNTDLNSF